MRQAWPSDEGQDAGMVAGVLLVITFVAGVTLGWLAGTGGQPHCPQEDSCRADYREGHWVIVEVTP